MRIVTRPVVRSAHLGHAATLENTRPGDVLMLTCAEKFGSACVGARCVVLRLDEDLVTVTWDRTDPRLPSTYSGTSELFWWRVAHASVPLPLLDGLS